MLFAIVPRGTYFYILFFTASSVSQHGYIFCLVDWKLKILNGGIELQYVDDQFRDEKKNKIENEIRTRLEQLFVLQMLRSNDVARLLLSDVQWSCTGYLRKPISVSTTKKIEELFHVFSFINFAWTNKNRREITRRVITKKWTSLESRSLSLVKFNGAVDLWHTAPPYSLVVPVVYHKITSHAPYTPQSSLLPVLPIYWSETEPGTSHQRCAQDAHPGWPEIEINTFPL